MRFETFLTLHVHPDRDPWPVFLFYRRETIWKLCHRGASDAVIFYLIPQAFGRYAFVPISEAIFIYIFISSRRSEKTNHTKTNKGRIAGIEQNSLPTMSGTAKIDTTPIRAGNISRTIGH